VNIPNAILEEIRCYAKKFPNEESCGVIIKDRVLKFLPCENLSKNKLYHFVMDPFILIENNVVVLFHSHVNSSSSPSCLDKKIMYELGLPFLIYSLRDDNFDLH